MSFGNCAHTNVLNVQKHYRPATLQVRTLLKLFFMQGVDLALRHTRACAESRTAINGLESVTAVHA